MIGVGRQGVTAKSRGELPGVFVDLSAGVTHYELRGDPAGEHVVLIHGNAAAYVTWDNTIDDLCAAGLRVLRYDPFGHGFSDRPRLHTYDRRLYDNQLAELLDRLEVLVPIRVAGSFRVGGKRMAILANWRGGALRDATSCYRGVGEQGIPIFLTWGTLDRSVAGDSMRLLRDLLPGIEYHELEGAGHLAHHEYPDRVNPPLIESLMS